MSFLSNMKIRTKILGCFAIIIFLGIVQGIISIKSLKGTAQEVDELNNHADNVIIPINDLKAEFRSLRIYAIRLSTCEPKDIAEYKGKIATSKKEVTDSIKKLEAASNSETVDLLEKILANLKGYESSYEHIYKVCDDADQSKYQPSKQHYILKYTRDEMKQYGDGTDELVEKLLEISHKKTNAIRSNVQSETSVTPIVVFTILNIIIAILFTSYLSKSISHRTANLANAANHVAEGDLTVEVEEGSNDEIGKVATATATMIGHLREIISNMSTHSETISSAAEELQYANKAISDSTSQILTQTLTVSAASEEMAATSKEIANNCNSAALASEQTKETTLNSIETVRSTVAKIREHSKKTEEDASIIAKLGDETKQIDAIIATIQDIANQTNLLALNAAIEAARAGEHGRGFAVVSDEVRALANRTAQSTQEINKMIKAVQDEVSIASNSIGETVSQMEEIASETEQLEHWLDTIINQVNDVNNQINQIAVATEEQTATSSDMSQNLQKMADLTKEVSTNASDTVESASSMAKLSNEMAEDAAKFSI